MNEWILSWVALSGVHTLFLFLESDVCNPNACRNGGTCREESGIAVCACPVQFEGDRCEGMVAKLGVDQHLPETFVHVIRPEVLVEISTNENIQLSTS